MVPVEARAGYIFRYSYLWHSQYLEGREEGVKDRPCLVLAIVMLDEDGSPVVRVLPITHMPPANLSGAVEIPLIIKKRLDLDHERSWIVLTESNRFTWPGPDIRPVATENGYFGAIPPALFAEIKRRFVVLARAGQHASTLRTD